MHIRKKKTALQRLSLKDSINVIVTLSLDIAEHKTFPEV